MKNKLLLKLFFALILISCKKEIYENFATLKIDGNFLYIETKGICDVKMKNGNSPNVLIEFNPEIHDIFYTIKNDSLIINSKIKNGLKPIKSKPLINVSFEDIKKLVTKDPTYVCSDDTIFFQNIVFYSIGEIGGANLTFNCNVFDMANSANTLGHYIFKGKSNLLILYNRYGSTIFADSVYTENALIINESAGDVYVNVKEQIDIRLQGTGNIYCRSRPRKINILEDRGKGGKFIILD